MKILGICNKIIKFSFYALFFLVPLVFTSTTSELFELPKMWLTFAFTILIAFSWVIKGVSTKKIFIQKTPLDLPIGIFFASQVISTIFSWDIHTSIWGYYSRFNGGLLSIASYIFLYYAFVSNLNAKEEVEKILKIIIASAVIVALWGLPSHFGYDPTCFLFRGSLDVSCWTVDFLPKLRIFSTLGQPAWLGAYLVALSPLLFALFLNEKRRLFYFLFFLLSVLFYLDIIFTRSRAALIAFWVTTGLFAAYYFRFEQKLKGVVKSPLSILLIIFFASSIIFGFQKTAQAPVAKENQSGISQIATGGGTESGKIRLYVWQGALNAWLHNPIIGTGVETFAFAYYKYKPVGHNLTSEWNYLYNKAHNEYLNFLATTGIFGFSSYLFMIGTFLFIAFKYLKSNIYHRKSSIINDKSYLIPALVAGYLSILITNFFGFSVVIVNIFFFMFPAFVFIPSGQLKDKDIFVRELSLGNLKKLDISVAALVSLYLLFELFNFFRADQAYGLGGNLARAGEYIKAYASLREAVDRAPFEPTYKDELASNDSILAVSLLGNFKDSQKASQAASFSKDLAKEAIALTSQVTREHQNNVVFLKTKVRIFYVLSQTDPKYIKDAIDAIKKVQILAPTDANIYYNLGLLYGQDRQIQKAIETLKQAIKLKPNYINAYYALGLFYRQLATNDKGQVIDSDLEQKGVFQMQYILKNLDPKNQDAKDALKLWTGQ